MVQQALCLQLIWHGTCLNDLHQRSHPHILLNQLHSSVTLRATSSTWDKVKSGKKKVCIVPMSNYKFTSSPKDVPVCVWRNTAWSPLLAGYKMGPLLFLHIKKNNFVTLTVILISSGPSCSWADLLTLNSLASQLSKSRKANQTPSLQKEKVNSQFFQCKWGSRAQYKSMLPMPHTQSVL